MQDNRTLTEISQDLNRLGGLLEKQIELDKNKDSEWNKFYAGTWLVNGRQNND